ncbi:MAG TPA: 50S ribosomal protein L15 [Firmicutes bacterium]|nr:50S ribosomal protein L15 [Bacillota bacterium]
MRLHELAPNPGSRTIRRRVGRGIGSGLGKTSGRGQKGQSSRSGGTKGAAFEGGQTPLQRRLPKGGFKNYPFKKEYAVVNLEKLAALAPGTVVTEESLQAAGLVKDIKDGVKILGRGELDKALTVKVTAVSKAAAEKITAAGGTIEVV